MLRPDVLVLQVLHTQATTTSLPSSSDKPLQGRSQGGEFWERNANIPSEIPMSINNSEAMPFTFLKRHQKAFPVICVLCYEP